MTLILLILRMFICSGTSDGQSTCTWYLFLSCSSCSASSAIWCSWSFISGCFSQSEILRQLPAFSSTLSTCSWCRGTPVNPSTQDRWDRKNRTCTHSTLRAPPCFFTCIFSLPHRLGFRCSWWLWLCSLCLCYSWANLSTSTGKTRAETTWTCTGWGCLFCLCVFCGWLKAVGWFSLSLRRVISVYGGAVRRSSLSCMFMIWRRAPVWTATPPALTASQRR